MSRHAHAANTEWGSKARKEEDRLRGLNNQDRRMAIAEGWASRPVTMYDEIAEMGPEEWERVRQLLAG